MKNNVVCVLVFCIFLFNGHCFEDNIGLDRFKVNGLNKKYELNF